VIKQFTLKKDYVIQCAIAYMKGNDLNKIIRPATFAKRINLQKQIL